MKNVLRKDCNKIVLFFNAGIVFARYTLYVFLYDCRLVIHCIYMSLSSVHWLLCHWLMLLNDYSLCIVEG